MSRDIAGVRPGCSLCLQTLHCLAYIRDKMNFTVISEDFRESIWAQNPSLVRTELCDVSLIRIEKGEMTGLALASSLPLSPASQVLILASKQDY